MTSDEALARLDKEAKRYRRAKAALDEARDRTVVAVVEALRAGHRPSEVDRHSPFTPTYNRQKAREHGIKRPTSGPGSKRAEETP